MNYANFQQNGGFPLETNTLDFMQKAFRELQVFGALAGDKSIIKGCRKSGNEITDGYIYFNEELFFFKGGIKQDTIVIIEEVQEVEFEDKTNKEAYFTRYATFGASANSFNWSEFKPFYTNQPILKEVKWVDKYVTNEELPNGWYIADGKNGTRNILGRMIVAQDPTQPEFRSVGQVGGEKTHKLTISEMPRHNHDWKRTTERDDDDTGGSYNEFTQKPGNIPSNDGRNPIGKAGSDQPHNNLPPYIVMIPIQFIG
ncbi:hypothetical protein PL373_16225 [Tenacibaculum maritimum]|nr:hypothetical protein [Tenacibaculum maritimum]MDB0602649.1 hypothetical protein [Tenacibaculum maritimum]MDB0611240.1 hypothetical protein [Tenacibaculum maritimum]